MDETSQSDYGPRIIGQKPQSIDEARNWVGDAVRQGHYESLGAGNGYKVFIPNYGAAQLTGPLGEMPTQAELSKAFGIPLPTRWTDDISRRVLPGGD